MMAALIAEGSAVAVAGLAPFALRLARADKGTSRRVFPDARQQENPATWRGVLSLKLDWFVA
jgi:hypothetical protein